ncbi:MAG: divergent polysaccharide deacetylase family protein [Nitratireductor sp.]
MEDLNKPLGKKSAVKKSDFSLKKIITPSNIAICLGVIAIAFVAYDRLNPNTLAPQDQNTIDQIALNANDPNALQLRDTRDNKEEEKEEPNIDSEPSENDSNNSISQIQEVNPTGSMEVSKPRPKPKKLPVFKPQDAQLAHLPDPKISENTRYGILPVQGPQGQRALDIYSREPDTTGNFGVARVVLIIGGMGISQSSTQLAIKKLPPSVTYAFAPYGNSLNRWMQTARKKGHELLIQVPMEPIDYPNNNPGTQTLLTTLPPKTNLDNLHWSMGKITNYVGVMNYLGAKFNKDARAMTPVFKDLSERGLLYVDDGSLKNSKAEQVAAQTLLPFIKGHIRIDNVRTRRDIAIQLQALAKEAKRTGLAVGIANAFPDTINLIAQFTQKARKAGIEITPVSAAIEHVSKNRN